MLREFYQWTMFMYMFSEVRVVSIIMYLYSLGKCTLAFNDLVELLQLCLGDHYVTLDRRQFLRVQSTNEHALLRHVRSFCIWFKPRQVYLNI